jgi:thymidylate kinase
MKIFAFEGADGCGKTTTVQAVATELTDLGFKVKTVCWLYDGIQRDPAARAMWYVRRMRDWYVLERGFLVKENYDYVLMDRSWVSTLAYQGCLAGCDDVHAAISVALQAQGLYKPDLVFKLSSSADTALQRIASRGVVGEHETHAEAIKLQQIYSKPIPEFLRAHGVPMLVVADDPVDKVRDIIIDKILAMLQPSFFSKPVVQV